MERSMHLRQPLHQRKSRFVAFFSWGGVDATPAQPVIKQRMVSFMRT